MDRQALEIIHASLINGQRKQMVEQINAYGLYDFWLHFKEYLSDLYHESGQYDYFTDATIGYFRITNR